MTAKGLEVPRGDSRKLKWQIYTNGQVPTGVQSGQVTFTLAEAGTSIIVLTKTASPDASGLAIIDLLEADTSGLKNDCLYDYEFRFENGNEKHSATGVYHSLTSLQAP